MDHLISGESLRGALRPRGPVHLEISELQLLGAVVLTVEGELDLLTAPKLAARIDEIMRRGRVDVVLDLRGTEFIDSVGLGVLMSAHRRLARGARRFAVVCGEGPVRRVIERARLVETLGVTSSIDQPI